MIPLTRLLIAYGLVSAGSSKACVCIVTRLVEFVEVFVSEEGVVVGAAVDALCTVVLACGFFVTR